MANFNFEIPDDVHKEFKIKCIRIERDMRDVLNDMIKEYINRGDSE